MEMLFYMQICYRLSDLYQLHFSVTVIVGRFVSATKIHDT